MPVAAFILAGMRRNVALLGFVGAVFVLGAILSPPVFLLGQALAENWPGFQPVAEHPFPRYVSRITMALAVFGLFLLMRIIHVRPRDVGISVPDWKNLARGMALALVVLGAFVAVAFLADARYWRANTTMGRIGVVAASALATAMVVAPLEELVFRGVFFGLLRQGNRWIAALVISSGVFALVHFLHRPGDIGPVGWASGFDVLARMFVPDSTNAIWITQLLNLSICGGILAWTYQRTGTLWFSIGLHAGWIFWLKLANSVTRVTADDATLWGTRKLVDGWGATVALLLTAALVPIITRTHETPASKTTARLG